MSFPTYQVWAQLSSQVSVFLYIIGSLQIKIRFHSSHNSGALKTLGVCGVGTTSPPPGTYFWLASISNRADRAEVPFFPTGGPVDSRECVEMGPVICKPFMAAPF